ncbi:MAG: MerR family transcriptional regulator [Desulfuromonadales bacterium]|nr:MerR family transcriptional regulator [Desulfuromonadales bacterium]
MANTLFSITEIECETGISRDTLRVWERRYGFPAPLRNQRSERVYSGKELERLRLIKQLLDRGMRPGTLVKLDDQKLRQLADEHKNAVPVSPDVEELLEILASGASHALQPRLEAKLLQYGLRNFVSEVVAPMNHAVGEAWFAGKIGVLDEHYYSEQVRALLTTALSGQSPGAGTPRVLLTTLPGEQHGIGLLMVACMMSLEGAAILSLGVQTPLEEIVRGAVEGACDIVALSCSDYMGRRTIARQLVRLRKLLPRDIVIWVGGRGVNGIRFMPDKIRLFNDLQQIAPAIQAEQRHPPDRSEM